MAIGVAGIFDIDQIRRDHFKLAVKDAGLGERMAMERFDNMAEGFEGALKESAYVLNDDGFKEATTICDRILKAGGYKNLIY